MPYGFDTNETQVHPDMDGLADQFLAPPETILDDAPAAPLVARNLQSHGLVSCIVFFGCNLLLIGPHLEYSDHILVSLRNEGIL